MTRIPNIYTNKYNKIQEDDQIEEEMTEEEKEKEEEIKEVCIKMSE
jgi:hypothetical protein